jgi:hypothetical protein
MEVRGTRRLVEETEAHVVVRLLLLLGLLLGGGVLSGGTTGGSTTSSGGGGGTRAGADVQEELLDVLALKSLFATSQTNFPGCMFANLPSLEARLVLPSRKSSRAV